MNQFGSVGQWHLMCCVFQFEPPVSNLCEKSLTFTFFEIVLIVGVCNIPVSCRPTLFCVRYACFKEGFSFENS